MEDYAAKQAAVARTTGYALGERANNALRAPRTEGPYTLATGLQHLVDNNNRLAGLVSRLERIQVSVSGQVPKDVGTDGAARTPGSLLDAIQSQTGDQGRMLELAHGTCAQIERALGIDNG